MAEGGFEGVPCGCLTDGVCRCGRQCPNAYLPSRSVDNVCRYFLRGECMRGDTCHYEHIRPGSRAADSGQRLAAEGLASSRWMPNPEGSAGGSAWRGVRPPLLDNPSGSRGLPETWPQTAGTSTIRFDDPTSETPRASSRAEAPEWEPGWASWQRTTERRPPEGAGRAPLIHDGPLCPFELANEGCPVGSTCRYLHRQVCDLCNEALLHPYNQEQRMQHREECVDQHQRDMELAFAIQRSADKTCGICMDVVLDREEPSERRFGLLERCSHIFCLRCIRHWRRSRLFDLSVIRACPECRVPSDFVTPSNYWVDMGEEKDKLIDEYKSAMREKPCRYFREGRGRCPFGGACFYKHEYPDGTVAELPVPQSRRMQDGESEAMRRMSLWVVMDIEDEPLPDLEWDEVSAMLLEAGFDWAEFEETLD